MTTTPFGDRLKREREMRGVSLEEVSHATRISTRYLEALEAERWSGLPGGVFNRGFIRTISKFLGLDEADLLGEYAEATKDLPVGPARGSAIAILATASSPGSILTLHRPLRRARPSP